MNYKEKIIQAIDGYLQAIVHNLIGRKEDDTYRYRKGKHDAAIDILELISDIPDEPDEEKARQVDMSDPCYEIIRYFTDINLVQELRRRGYEVTCKKTIEL